MSNSKIFRFLSRKFQPNGRAWRVQHGTPTDVFYKVHALATGDVADASKGLIDHVIPDTENFNEDDCTVWEKKLGIISAAGASVTDRRAGIRQKWNYPGDEKYRQHLAFVEDQLRLAGYDVHVYENRYPDGAGGYYSLGPSDILGTGTGMAAYGDFGYGELGYGDTLAFTGTTIVADYLEEEFDQYHWGGGVYDSTFIIAGATIDTFVDVPLARKNQFRQLILQLKQQQAWVYLFVNYV